VTDELLPPVLDLPSATCVKCGGSSIQVHWHVLPILQDAACAAPQWSGEHLCLTCSRCRYSWATRTLEDS
jgi:hypothetical protein